MSYKKAQKGNSVKSEKQYMNKVRNLTEIENTKSNRNSEPEEFNE